MFFSSILSYYLLISTLRIKSRKYVLEAVLLVFITTLNLITKAPFCTNTFGLVVAVFQRILILSCGMICLHRKETL